MPSATEPVERGVSIVTSQSILSSAVTLTTVPRQIICAYDLIVTRAEGRQVPSIGPFDFTEAEVIGLEFLRQEDERQLRKTGLHATWSGRMLTVKSRKFVFRPRKGLENIESRSSSLPPNLPTI